MPSTRRRAVRPAAGRTRATPVPAPAPVAVPPALTAWAHARAGEVLGRRDEGWVVRVPEGAVAVHLLDVAPDEALLARVRALTAVRHDHLAGLVEVVPLDAGGLLVATEHHEATALADLRRARAPISAPEALTLVIPIAQALAALHARGLVHGAVGEATVAVRPDGRPVLLDQRAALLGLGTPRTDVARLLGAVLAQMAPAELHEQAGGDGRAVHELLSRLRLEPPTAERLVGECFAAGEPAPVRMPDGAALAAALVGNRPVGPAPAAGARRARRGRARRRRRVAGAVGGALGGLAATLTIGWLVAAGTPGATAEPPATSRSSGVGSVVLDREDPAGAAAALTRLRVAALADASVEALRASEVAGGPAHADDATLVARLGGERREGLDVVVHRVRTLDRSEVSALVEVASSTTAHRRVAADGSADAVPASTARAVVLELRWTGAPGWRVWAVRPVQRGADGS